MLGYLLVTHSVTPPASIGPLRSHEEVAAFGTGRGSGNWYADAPAEKCGRQYLHEIVANGRNGLDVDKFDYLQRDARCCGVLIAADIDRLRTFSKATVLLNVSLRIVSLPDFDLFIAESKPLQ